MSFDDFPAWLRFAHFINLIFITLLIRSGIEILSALPKLYWKDHATPGTEWIRFTKKGVPKNRLWSSLEEEESFSSWIALPGKKNLGLGRHWHFVSAIFWGANGIIYFIMLFSSGQWVRFIPTSPSIFSEALQTALMYASLQSPPPGDPYNPLQQLTYFGVIFMLGPLMVATGAAMSPSLDARYPSFPKIFGGRQAARSLHFLGTIAFLLFIAVHISMVVLENFPQKMGNIVLGNGENMSFITAIGLFAFYIASVAIVHVWATAISKKYPRLVQNILDKILVPSKWVLFRNVTSKQHFETKEISPFFRVNGYPPDTNEYEKLKSNNFADWQLRVHGLVENPAAFSLEELRIMRRQSQITEHYCIQGWSAVGKWDGVSMKDIIEKCKPSKEAKYVVFHSYQYPEGDQFYEVLDIEIAQHPQTILAYEMNGQPLSIGHGAPLRLRVETQLGYKMVKWLKSIEFVKDYKHVGSGQGGWREDHMYYSPRAGI